MDVVDPNIVLDHVDVDALLDRVDVDALLDRVDVDALLDRVDVNRLLERVDVNQLLDRVDVNRLMERVDVDALTDRVDVQSLVDRAGIPEIVAESTGHLTGSALDFFRRPLVGLDEISYRAANRLVGRDPSGYPDGPGELVDWVEETAGPGKQGMTGHYAGPLTRFLALVVDMLAVTTGLTALAASLVFVIRLFIPDFAVPASSGIAYGIVLVISGFVYLWASYTVFGKTVGKALLGMRVVSEDGQTVLRAGQTFVRVLTYPLSFIVLGWGLLGALFNRERQTWHDRLAHTAVVYDWGSRTASMPTPLAEFLGRRGADV